LDAVVHTAEYLGDRCLDLHTMRLYGITVINVGYIICLNNLTLEHIFVMNVGTVCPIIR